MEYYKYEKFPNDKDRLTLYEDAIDRYKKNYRCCQNNGWGLCTMLESLGYTYNIENLKEIKEQKPINTFDNVFWFDEKNYKVRIKLLINAVANIKNPDFKLVKMDLITKIIIIKFNDKFS